MVNFKRRSSLKRYAAGALAGALLGSSVLVAEACTRVVYLGEDQQIITARSMDWREDVGSDMWIFPRDMKRHGAGGANSLEWTSKYGSVIVSGYGVSTTDGVNEKGLVANLLWLVESEYPINDGKRPALSIAAWAQYVLDNYATVDEAVKGLSEENFVVVTADVPGQGRLATLHLSISDSSGDSAIIEYIDGKQVIHHSRAYQVMTNSPAFEKQLALDDYWQEIGGTTFLPGTNRAADRFARASFYVNAVPQKQSANHAVASMMGVIRNVSVPYGLAMEDQPNISSTRWRTLVDHKRQLYFFDSAMSPNTFWVDLKKVDFKPGSAKVLKLGPEQSTTYAGEVSASFVDHKPFEFLGL